MPTRFASVRILTAGFVLAFSIAQGMVAAPQISSFDLERARQMLRDARDLVRKHYYDPQLHGLDWDARFKQADEKLQGVAHLGQAFGVIAGFLDGLKDSHTYFRPPARQVRTEYGFRMQLVGDTAYITRTRPGTDAESKLHSGDQILLYNTFAVNRIDYRDLAYYFFTLAPQPVTKLNLRDPAGVERQVTVESKMRQKKKVLDISGGGNDFDIWQIIREEENEDHVSRTRYVEMGDAIFVKLPEFFLTDSEVDHLFSVVKKHKTLVLDLRGNPGGLVVTLERMIGSVFDHEVKVADRAGRKEMKPEVAKSRGGNAFTGNIIVLVDSGSASAAELFARIMQLENRGKVIGDRSSGSVMEARGYSCSQGADTKVFYSFSITEADMIMKDGKSLEHTGVTPDEIVLPTAKDLAEGRDPALARAAELAGVKVDPAAAGKMFPFEWLPI
jgi:carboxyl-terminal processing protease